ncbi:uncharacterized protein LOC117104866 isoform X2 [Anneissia japonica]|uniref:uncharacterized protein LOC117104866 isoform X2 n=1 Tax=Anneissia japonica TaxID=1529436 RepID=UPI0014259AA1|nr:uncharacterized protein LOC117104866 isoform X2 [Anneissia japonica]
MARLPTPCQLNYDRDLPSPLMQSVRTTQPRYGRLPSKNGRSGPRTTLGFSRLPYEKHTNNSNDIETTPYRYSSASFPSPIRDNPPQVELPNALSRDVLEQLYNCERLTGTSYSLPVLRSRSGIETSHTVNAQHLDEPTWNRCLNAWVGGKPTCHHAHYVKIAGPMNLNNRGIFHFVREYDRLPPVPCERFHDHMHQRRFPKPTPEKMKKTLEKPKFWEWKGRRHGTEPVIPTFSKTKPPLPAVSPAESRVSNNSLTSVTSGIVSCESYPSTLVPEPVPPRLFYLPAAPRLPSVVPWEREDDWGNDISVFNGECVIIPRAVYKSVRSCCTMLEHPFLLEQVTVLTHKSLNSWSGHINLPVEQILVPPHPLISSNMVKINGVDRVTIEQAPLHHKLPNLPPAPPPKVATPEVKLPPMAPAKPKTPPPKSIELPRKRKEIIKKQKPVIRKVVKNADVAKPSTPQPTNPVELPLVVEQDEESPQPVPQQPLPTPIPEPQLPEIIPIECPDTPVRTPTPPPKTQSPSTEPAKHKPLGMPEIDPSIGLELERQRRADERRRKALLMYENLKKRKQVLHENPQISLTLMDSGWLAQFCIIKREKEDLYRRAFESVDEDSDGFLTCQEMLLALKTVSSVNSLSDAEEEYVYRVLELAGYTVLNGADFKLFSVVAALTQKIASIDNWMKNLIQRMDFKMLDMKVFRAKELFLWNVDEATNQLSLERLMIELKAGGVSQEHQDEVKAKLGHLGTLDVLDFLTYLPLFILMHSSVISNPFDTTRDK